ncbi:MAG TPA: ABC transporter permease [Longimicrobiales bacterium]|nr:ABC transporter permease [Longimicrobiales bacterium]
MAGRGTIALFLQALHVLRKSPALLAMATVALALGVAAPTTMFSIMHGVLRELPVPRPEEMVDLRWRHAERGFTGRLRAHEITALREQQRAFRGIAAYQQSSFDAGIAGERPFRRSGLWIEPHGFELLGVAPPLGRGFTVEDARPGAPPVALISHRLWQEQYAGSTDVLGATIRLEGTATTIVGVMPEGFRFPDDQDLWLPLLVSSTPDPATLHRGHAVFARLRPGVPMEQAEAEVAIIARRLELERPELNEHLRFEARRYRETLLPEDIAVMLRTMVLLVSFILVIACANVANLLLARAVVRTREVAVRAALGATRRRIIGEHLLEATVIAAGGGALGFVLSRFAMAAFERSIMDGLPYWITFRLEWEVLAFALGTVMVAALGAGLIPALQASGVDVHDALKDDSRGASSFRVGKVSRGLVVVEVALSCGLLVVCGLMIKGTVLSLRHTDWEPREVLTARWQLRSSAYPGPSAVVAFDRAVLEELAARPEVAAAALTTQLPGVSAGWGRIEVEGSAWERAEDVPVVGSIQISPGFFDVFGKRLLAGRDVAWSDDSLSQRVVLVNRPFAEAHWPGEDALEKRLRNYRDGDPEEWAVVVGVAPHLGVRTGQDETDQAVYWPISQLTWSGAALVARASRGDPASLTPVVRAAVETVDPEVPLWDFDRLDRIIARSKLEERVFSVLFGFFGLAALLLATVGLYGVMAFSVSRRTREVGVRIALGARPAQVVWLVVRGGTLQLALGAVLGVAIALLVAPHMGEALMGSSPRDASVYAVILGVLCITGMVAALVPARRAVGVEVVEALRDE